MEEQNTDGFVTPNQNPPTTPQPTQPPALHANAPVLHTPDPISQRPGEYTTTTPPKKPAHNTLKGFLSIFQLIAGAFALAFVINKGVFQSYEVFGQSMTPTLHEGDRLIISKLGKSWSTIQGDPYIPKRGEIIVFHNPNNEVIQLVKRVIALPGERVVVKDGVLTVYTADQPEGFNYNDAFDLKLVPTIGDVDLVVPDGEIFVSGDNRGQGGSLDSRNELGTIPFNQIVGDLAFRIYPLSDAGAF